LTNEAVCFIYLKLFFINEYMFNIEQNIVGTHLGDIDVNC